MPPKRKASEQSSGAAVEVKKSRATAKGDGISTLIPVNERKVAKKGVRDPELLHMLCKDKVTNEKKELHFKKIVHAEIDWDDKKHIDKINAWRNQIYGRAGFKNKTVVMWSKDEEAYLELYWQLLVVEANKRDILMPKPKIIREDFNAFFKGKVFRAPGGGEYPPREDRDSGPFMSKMGRLTKALKPYLEEKARGKRGESFYPKINQTMLSEYLKLKADLAKLGCEDAKIIPWGEVEDELNTNQYVLRCREYLADLPDQSEVELNEPEEGDTTLVDTEEQDKLDKELLELATEAERENKVEPMETDEQPFAVPSASNPPATAREVTPVATKEVPISHNENADVTSYEASPVASGEVVTPHKKRADSVAPAAAAAEDDDDSELTLVGEEAIVEKIKDSATAEIHKDTVQDDVDPTVEDQAAHTLLSIFTGS